MTVNYLNGNPALQPKETNHHKQLVDLENVTIGVGFAGVIALLTMSLVVVCIMVLV
ncbi:MAG: hypothetical protein ABRQ24_04905 [Syntrophomonadaceae bacterium]